MVRKPRPSFKQRLVRGLVLALLALVLAPPVLTVLYAFVPVPATPLMVLRLFQGYGWHRTWVPLGQISPAVPRSVIAAEDNLFCSHDGVDWKAWNTAYARWQAGRRSKGASTISMQTAKNLFLWPGRSPVRKALEIPLTYLLEGLMGKPRILEIYLNVAEWGPGVYGIEAAARHHFKTSAKRLTPQQAALLAAILPNPLHWSARNPGPYVRQRAYLIQRRSYQLGPMLLCAQPPRTLKP